MRGLERDKRTFWYCTMDPEIRHMIVDENGNETGEIVPHYETATAMRASVSPATGQSQSEQFGNLDNYDKVIVIFDMSCPIDENTVLFVDHEPSYSEVTAYEIVQGQTAAADDEIEPVTYLLPKNDYIVKRVARSLNVISIAVQKVEVG